jgi:hypothetical protein
MSLVRGMFVVCGALALLIVCSSSPAQSFNRVGGLDCNGFSLVQKPLRPQDSCTDFRSEYGRGYDNGHYIGHDEPSVGFYSLARHSGNNMRWEITLPREHPLPATQSFENYITFWFGLALCDPGSFPNGACIPDSDENTPQLAGSAFLEMQFYPPGNPPFITQISCDLIHWCASLHINSLEIMSNGKQNPNCGETTNFAFIQRNGVPTGPPGPNTMTVSSNTPNAQTLLMNQGDRLRITIRDVEGDLFGGVRTEIEDLTTGRSGFMIASAHNGYQTTDPNTCAGTNFSFHPEFDTAKFGNFVPWAALQGNVNFAFELGHFTPGVKGDHDADDAPCFPGPTVAGCLDLATGGDLDFDGSSYRFDWPDGTTNNATSVAIQSVNGGGIGPLSASDEEGGYNQPYPIIQFETEILASEVNCQPNGEGCVVPPAPARFYPFYALATDSASPNEQNCALIFGNFSGLDIKNFGGDAEYGPPDLPWFFGQSSGGPISNPCIPNPRHRDSD